VFPGEFVGKIGDRLSVCPQRLTGHAFAVWFVNLLQILGGCGAATCVAGLVRWAPVAPKDRR